MIYLDTSVVLAHIFAEPRRPDARLWDAPLVSSRLLSYEVLTRVQARDPGAIPAARAVFARLSWLELSPQVLARAEEQWPIPLRTLDALHLASAIWLRDRGQRVQLASWDGRMVEAARALELPLWEGSAG